MNSYTVAYERDEDGWWVAYVPAIPGCHTQGRTIDQARRRIREALGLWVDDADTAVLIDDVRLPANVSRTLEEYREAKGQAERERAKAQDFSVRAVRALMEDMHLSVRDAAELLGISHQRVQQLLPGAARTQSSIGAR